MRLPLPWFRQGVLCASSFCLPWAATGGDAHQLAGNFLQSHPVFLCMFALRQSVCCLAGLRVAAHVAGEMHALRPCRLCELNWLMLFILRKR